MVNIIQVAMSLENVEATRASLLLVLLVLAPVALGGSALGGWFLARRALAPVDGMVEAARRIEAEDLTKRLPVPSGGDELGRLAARIFLFLDFVCRSPNNPISINVRGPDLDSSFARTA
jgi:HAMP domain-containing protein